LRVDDAGDNVIRGWNSSNVIAAVSLLQRKFLCFKGSLLSCQNAAGLMVPQNPASVRTTKITTVFLLYAILLEWLAVLRLLERMGCTECHLEPDPTARNGQWVAPTNSFERQQPDESPDKINKLKILK
jgi:hypothetical protein